MRGAKAIKKRDLKEKKRKNDNTKLNLRAHLDDAGNDGFSVEVFDMAFREFDVFHQPMDNVL